MIQGIESKGMTDDMGGEEEGIIIGGMEAKIPDETTGTAGNG